MITLWFSSRWRFNVNFSRTVEQVRFHQVKALDAKYLTAGLKSRPISCGGVYCGACNMDQSSIQ